MYRVSIEFKLIPSYRCIFTWQKLCQFAQIMPKITQKSIKAYFAPASAVKGRLHRAFNPFSARQPCHANEAHQGQNSCPWLPCPGDMALRMRKVLIRLRVAARVCQLLLLFVAQY